MKDYRTIELEIMNQPPALKSLRMKLLREELGSILAQHFGVSGVAAEWFMSLFELLWEEKMNIAKERDQ